MKAGPTRNVNKMQKRLENKCEVYLIFINLSGIRCMFDIEVSSISQGKFLKRKCNISGNRQIEEVENANTTEQSYNVACRTEYELSQEKSKQNMQDLKSLKKCCNIYNQEISNTSAAIQISSLLSESLACKL